MAAPRFTTGWVHNLTTAPRSTDAGRIIAIASAFSAISLLCILIRLAQRWTVFKAFGLDDIAATCSMLLGTGYSLAAILQTQYGLGLTAADFPLINAVPFSRIQYIGGPIYCLATLGFKVSLLASYLRLAGFNQTYRYVLHAVLALVILNQLLYACLLSFACRPIAKQWDPALDGTCIDQLPTYFGLGGSSLGFDILIILLPFPILQRLQLDLSKKLALGCLFALGFFVSVIQIIRVRTIAALANYTDSAPIIVWSIVEIHTGVVIACMPAFAPLLKKAGSRVSHTYRSDSGSRKRKAGGAAGQATIGSTPQARRVSKGASLGNSLGTSFGAAKSTNEIEAADDEVMLWAAPQHKWPAETHAWSGDAHPVSELRAEGQTVEVRDEARWVLPRRESRGESGDPRAREITVVREVTVRTHLDDGR
ncbi:hypothetical protein LTR53_007216 [Teratosphaeriaceae sp. CCFEE 6253]|nr:hypothetical protein LTR53_007216 [Teratosphaeriaceae sp. CCFEE 6253]